MKRKSSDSDPEKPTTSGFAGIPSKTTTTSMAHEKTQKRVGKRPGRKPSKIDQKAKLERSRQSARECRARKKLRYQYLEELVSSREKAVFSLREEVEMYKRWSVNLDSGIVPDGLLKLLAQEEMQKAVTVQTSPQSSSSTTSPSGSPVPRDMEQHLANQQVSGNLSRALGYHLGQPPGQVIGHGQVSSHTDRSQGQVVAHGQISSHTDRSQGQVMGQHHGQVSSRHTDVDRSPGQVRRQELVRQPSMHQQTLTSLNRPSRSFEESSLSSSSSSSSSLFRSGSVPNLVSSFPRNAGDPLASTSTPLVYRDFDQLDNSTLGSMGFTPRLSKMVSETQTGGNIPTVVCQRSPPSTVSQPPTAAWNRVGTAGDLAGAATHASHFRTFPVDGINRTAQIPHPSASQSRMFSDSFVSSGASSTVTSSSNLGMAASPAVVPYYQRPRSSSDLGRKVSSSVALPSSTTTSLSHHNLPDLLDPIATCYSSRDMHSTLTLSDSVVTCLTPSLTPQRATPVCVSSVLGAMATPVCVGSWLGASSSSSPRLMATQGVTPVCVGSELSASISEPIPHWYSFLDDLEKASFSARQGAFSDAGTPGSSRTRSGAGTPSSVDSPYSQQQQQGGGNDGNIPNIVTDLLGQPPPS